MARGLTQAFYKYLPSNWIDFYRRSDRASFTAYVTNWNSSRIEGINEVRLLQQVDRKVKEFQSRGMIKDFVLPISKETYEVLTPKRGINADIIAEISPLTFYCQKCKKVYYYKSSLEFNKKNPNRRCKEKNCNGYLLQMRLVYACTCGWAGPLKPVRCRINKADGIKYIKFKPPFNFVCSRHPNKAIEMEMYCPECKKKLWPKNALDMGNQIPFPFTMIDLLNINQQNFIKGGIDAAKLVIGYWLEHLDRSSFQDLINNGLPETTNEEKEKTIQSLAKKFIKDFDIDPDKARDMAIASLGTISSEDKWTEALSFVNEVLHWHDQEHIENLDTQILEYDSIVHAKQVSKIEDAMCVASKLNTSTNDYAKTIDLFGFKTVQSSSNVPFIICVYGYTRKETEPGKAVLRGLTAESNLKKNIYATKLETEGILFEFNRRRIVEWMIKNRFINQGEDDIPDLDDEIALKTWFLNYVNYSAITTFTSIEQENKITFYVYNLIHTISHALIRNAATLCGLDKNSLSEYIFPNIPAIFIYCQNSQGFNMGALTSLFEAYLDRWLKTTLDKIDKCIFDPICIDRDHACAGCLYLSEISCVHFNKDLDRRYLVGWHDKSSNDRIIGFWEDNIK